VLTLGDPDTGKTSIILRFVDNVFHEKVPSNLGVDYKDKSIIINNESIRVSVWDTAGHERFKTITSNYYRGAHGVVVVFDISNKASFSGVSKWMQEISSFASEGIPIILVGNKSDLASDRIVEEDVVKEFVNTHAIPYIESSAKTSAHIDQIFQILGEAMLERRRELADDL